jgi:hypothetical protein
MPRFGGFNVGNIGGALVRNAVGTVASAVLPRNAFGGFGLGSGPALVGQRNLTQNSQNRRVSLRPKPAAASRVYGNGLLNPIAETQGLVWPYTPTISYNHNIDYQTIQTVHANQDFHIYSKTPAVELQINGDFTVQNQREGRYALAALHFLRTMAKMNFGENDPLAGTPPPVLLFDAYGPFVFNDLPVIVKAFQAEFPDNVDYVEVRVTGTDTVTTAATPAVTRDDRITIEPLPPASIAGNNVETTLFGLRNPTRTVGRVETISPASPASTNNVPVTYSVWLPAVFKISTTLVVQHTPKELRSKFSLPQFRNGSNQQKSFI